MGRGRHWGGEPGFPVKLKSALFQVRGYDGAGCAVSKSAAGEFLKALKQELGEVSVKAVEDCRLCGRKVEEMSASEADVGGLRVVEERLEAAHVAASEAGFSADGQPEVTGP